MRRFLFLIGILIMLGTPVQAIDLSAPAPPDFAGDFMPSQPQNLPEGIREVLKMAVYRIRPDLKEASRVCLGIAAILMIVSVVRSMPGGVEKTADLVGSIVVSVLLLSSTGALINLGAETVTQVSEYGKLLLPVLAAALGAQGAISTASALYAGTAFFDAILSQIIASILLPMIYVFLMLAIVNSAIGDDLMKKLKEAAKWLMTWSLKTLLYVFTGYIGITGVVSGPTDAAALKAAKLTISGFVPVVGGILSDASEAVLVSAGTVKNSIGLYGLFAVLAIWIGPFLKIGAHYLLLRLTGVICSIFGSKGTSDLISDFATAMGYLLGMTGAVCLMLLISTVCFMRGVN